MEAQTALVGADGAVELDTVAVVHLNLTLVVHPGNPEQDGALRGGQALQQSVAAVSVLVLLDHGAQRFQNLIDRLMKFGLVGILLFDPGKGLVNITHEQMSLHERLVYPNCTRIGRKKQGASASFSSGIAFSAKEPIRRGRIGISKNVTVPVE